ncbi:MAG: hypothetical protein K2X81_08785, partial [Candidatus Obscuribacterales bacterium]|nr:hypothetical protein [Candidatus Obscuribacterales bacterium]
WCKRLGNNLAAIYALKNLKLLDIQGSSLSEQKQSLISNKLEKAGCAVATTASENSRPVNRY